MYLADYNSNSGAGALYTVNLATGIATLIGDFGTNHGRIGSIASHAGVLYVLGGNGIWTVDISTGLLTRLWQHAKFALSYGLTSHLSSLYFITAGTEQQVYTIDLVAQTVTALSNETSMGQPTSLTSHGGLLYSFDQSSGSPIHNQYRQWAWHWIA